MANTKSAKKRAKQNIVRRAKNVERKTEIKTAVKKVLASIASGSSIEDTKALLRDAEAQLARAKGKGLLHAKTASRKISRLTQMVNKSAA
jgi:small subunit ribosomal protein S20